MQTTTAFAILQVYCTVQLAHAWLGIQQDLRFFFQALLPNTVLLHAKLGSWIFPTQMQAIFVIVEIYLACLHQCFNFSSTIFFVPLSLFHL